MEFGKRADAVGAQELVLVEHLGQDPAEPLRIEQCDHPPLGHPEITRARGVDSRRKFGDPAQAFQDQSQRPWDALPLPLFNNRRGAQGQKPHHGAHLEPCGAAVGEAQQIVVEAVLLVPHAVQPGSVHGRGDIVEVLAKLHDHVLVDGVVGGEFHCELHHVLGEEGHPGRAVRLLQVAAGGQRCAAVEDADVVEPEEAPLEDVLAEAVLAVHPPGEVQQQLVERRPEEIEVGLAAHGLLGAVQEERREGVDRGVHVAEVPLIGGHLAAGVQVDALEHQFHLILGEVGIDDRERERVEGQVPGRVPGVLPLVGHGDDVLVQHVEPLRVPGISKSGMEWVGVVLVQPVITVEEEELLAPEHAGNGLAHHVGRVRGDRGWGDGPVELVCLAEPGGQDLIKLLAEGGLNPPLPPFDRRARIYGHMSSLRRSRTVADWPGATFTR